VLRTQSSIFLLNLELNRKVNPNFPHLEIETLRNFLLEMWDETSMDSNRLLSSSFKGKQITPVENSTKVKNDSV